MFYSYYSMELVFSLTPRCEGAEALIFLSLTRHVSIRLTMSSVAFFLGKEGRRHCRPSMGRVSHKDWVNTDGIPVLCLTYYGIVFTTVNLIITDFEAGAVNLLVTAVPVTDSSAS